MAGQPNPKKIKFETQKEILDEVADDVACSICKIVPREIPLYVSPGGSIVCSTCKNANPEANFQQTDLTRAMDKVLSNLPRACKFRKNGCKRAANLNSIEYHEEDCEYRDILCSYGHCKETYSFNNFLDHMKNKHNFGFKNPSKDVNQNGSKFTLKSNFISEWVKEYEQGGKLTGIFAGNSYIGMVSGKKFFLNMLLDSLKPSKSLKTPRHVFFWIQILGSKFEAKNFKYSLQVEDPEFEGTSNYKGYVKSLDDKKTDVYLSSTNGLIISLEVIKKFPGDAFTMEIEIEDQKPKKDDEEAKDEK